jgi:hypothetical protein
MCIAERTSIFKMRASQLVRRYAIALLDTSDGRMVELAMTIPASMQQGLVQISEDLL